MKEDIAMYVWTNGPPMTSGQYWVAEKSYEEHTAKIIEVYVACGKLQVPPGFPYDINNPNAVWAGPIEKPIKKSDKHEGD
jgi:hypothetical protein